MTECSFDGCDRLAEKRTWCRTHYMQWRRTGTVFEIGTNPNRGRKRCTFPDCERFNFAYGLCAAHNKQKNLGIKLRPVRAARPDAEEGFNWCSHCKQFQPIDRFTPDRSRPGQHTRVCLDCNAAKMRIYNSTSTLARRWQRAAKKYGITKDEYEAFWTKQDGRCAICAAALDYILSSDKDLRYKSAIDHCHATGAVRGLLCGACNCAIGYMQDDPDRLIAAAQYIIQSKE